MSEWLRPLGNTGLVVSALGLGTVKLGRAGDVKYPRAFSIPDHDAARRLLDCAHEIGINLIDTAPAYGDSERRLGELLRGDNRPWILCSKVGEHWQPGPSGSGQSSWDFSPEATRASLRNSLKRLDRGYLDIVLVHSNGDDRHIIEQLGTLEALQEQKKEGLVRCVGFSAKSLEGSLLAASRCDLVMVSCNLAETGTVKVLDRCASLGRGVLVKKALGSGRFVDGPQIEAGLRLSLGRPGTSSVVIGSIDRNHLRQNVAIARSILAGDGS